MGGGGGGGEGEGGGEVRDERDGKRQEGGRGWENRKREEEGKRDGGGGGATRGVTVSMSAFLAYHQCYCAGSSLAWGLNLWAVVCGIFGSSSPGVFSGYSGFLPSRFSQQNKAQINAISNLSHLIAELSLRTKWHVTRHVARDERSMCCA